MYAINVRKITMSRSRKILFIHMSTKHNDDVIPYSFNELLAVIESTDCRKVIVKGTKTLYVRRLIDKLRGNISDRYIYFREI